MKAASVFILLSNLFLVTATSKVVTPLAHDSPTTEFELAKRERRVRDVYVAADDNTKLWTRIVLPRGCDFDTPGQNITTVLDRSPYGAYALELIADIYLAKGFAAVGQDMRGTKHSGGRFNIWHYDGEDGRSAIDYIADQPWSSGSVMSMGASADGLAAFTMLATVPEALESQFIIFSSSQGYPVIFPGGAYLENLADTWMQDTVRSENVEHNILQVKSNEKPSHWWDGKYHSRPFEVYLPGS